MNNVKFYGLFYPFILIVFIMFEFANILNIVFTLAFDSLLLIACYYIFVHSSDTYKKASLFYFDHILWVLLFDFISNAFSTSVINLIGKIHSSLGYFDFESDRGFVYIINPYNHPTIVLMLLAITSLTAFLLFKLNYHITFRKHIEDKTLKFKLSIIVAMFTAPWTYLLPLSSLFSIK